MKEKYNIVKSRAAISEQEILEKIDFNAQLKFTMGAEYGWLKWMAGVMTVTGIVAGLLLWGPERSSTPRHAEETLKGTIPWKSNADTTFTVNVRNGGNFEFQSGSVIRVPGNAFVDANGQPVKGPVQLRYREYHGPKDFFLSGIPMTYDSAGNQYHFESGGMIEILAFEGDRPVFASKDAPIRIEMISYQPGDQFNSYFLNDRNGKWEFLGKDTIGTSEPWKRELDSLLSLYDPAALKKQLVNELGRREKELVSMKNKAPKPFYEPKKGDFMLVVDVDSARFPEWSSFKNVRFAVPQTERNFAKVKAAKTWRDVKLSENDSAGWYKITFMDWTEKYSVMSRPVFSTADATKNNEEMKKYTNLLKRKETDFKNKYGMLQELNKRYEGDVEFDNTEKKKMLDWQILVGKTNETVMRVFNADRFGIYNCDCPKMLPKGMEVVAKICDPQGKLLKIGSFYLVEQGRNMMYTYYGEVNGSFKYNPKARNSIWAITLDGRLATLSADAFKKVKPVEDTCVYMLTIHPGRVSTEQDARRLLEL